MQYTAKIKWYSIIFKLIWLLTLHIIHIKTHMQHKKPGEHNRQVRSKDTPQTETKVEMLFCAYFHRIMPIWAEPAKPFTRYAPSKFGLFSLHFLSPFPSFCNTCWNRFCVLLKFGALLDQSMSAFWWMEKNQTVDNRHMKQNPTLV